MQILVPSRLAELSMEEYTTISKNKQLKRIRENCNTAHKSLVKNYVDKSMMFAN